MKIIAFISILIYGSAWGFDPVDPPPKRTFKWTVHFLMHARIPLVDFRDVSVIDAVATAAHIERPAEYRVTVGISDKEAVRDKRINIEAKDITEMELLAAISEQANLNMLIQPGIVVLVPRPRAEQAGSDQPATKPAENEPAEVQPLPQSSKDAGPALISDLEKAIEEQAIEVEKCGRALEAIVKAKGIVYRKSDDGQSEVVVDSTDAKGIQDYVDAKGQYEAVKEMIQQMKLKLISEKKKESSMDQ